MEDSMFHREKSKTMVNYHYAGREKSRKFKHASYDDAEGPELDRPEMDIDAESYPSDIAFKTFGKFDIFVNGHSILAKGYRQQGFMRLLVFFISNQDRVFSTNAIIKKVWPSKEYHNNDSVVRTQIFRLKKQLMEKVPELEFQLDFSHGGYLFKMNTENVTIDTDVFQNLCERIFSENLSDEEQLMLCRDVFDIYQDGFFVEETDDADWLISLRQRFRRQWFRVVELYVNICKNLDRNEDIISFCQEVLQFEEFEEFIHEIFMEALVDGGYAKDAMKHYEMMISMPTYHEVFRNATRLRELYMKAEKKFNKKQKIDKAMLHRFIENNENRSGALICESDIFLNYCYLLSLSIERLDRKPIICIIDILDPDYPCEVEEVKTRRFGNPHSEHEPANSVIKNILNQMMDAEQKDVEQTGLTAKYLLDVLRFVLRKNDVMCEWNEKQLLLLLACKREFNANNLLNRIKATIESENPRKTIGHLPLSIRVLPLDTLSGEL